MSSEGRPPEDSEPPAGAETPEPPETPEQAQTAPRWTERVGATVRGVRRRLREVPRPLRLAGTSIAFLLVAVAGAWLGLIVLGASHHPIGPVETTIRLEPSLTGDTRLELPPLGTLALDTHDGPVRLDVAVDRINQAEATRLFENPELLNGLEDEVLADVRRAVTVAAIRGLGAATLGALVVSLIVLRRFRPTVLAGGLAAAVVLATGGVAVGTWNPRAITEPRYTGLLSGAPSLVGNVSDIAKNFNVYSDQLVKLVTNVTQLYDVTSSLPAYTPDEDVIRVLHISDMELNEYAWDIVATISDQYSADLIVDTGDTTDHGTAPENAFLQRIPGLNLPYVWVRGNHDSAVTEDAMRSTKNVTVLDGGITEVAGIRFLGAGDPRFTPDRSSRNTKEEDAAVRRQALSLGGVARKAADEGDPVNVLAYHDPAGASAFDGAVPLILSGHLHNRKEEVLPGGSRLMVQGSTGGSGLRAMTKENGDEPYPIDLSVLYLNRDTLELEAWDDISLGGLGQTSAEIERHQVHPDDETQGGVGTPSPEPSPSGPVPETPLQSPTLTQSPPPTDTPSVPAPSSPPASPRSTREGPP